VKTVYISFLLHGNMCYDRYTKQEIRAKFPGIYAAGIRAMHRFSEVTAHIDFPGLTTLSLKHHASWLLDELRPLIERKQVVMVGCQYAASHALCADEESDLLAARLGMDITRDELQADTSTFFPQEIAFHPQSPYIMNQIGATRLIVMPEGWKRPRKVRGIDGSEVNVYPLDIANCRLEKLEEFHDSHDDGDFVMAGGDFELLGNVEAFVEKIADLAARGKLIEWTTVDRYEREVGIQDTCQAPNPFGQAAEDREASPSFSRWVGDPEDMIWHGHAVKAMDAVRSAGFAKVAARLHGLGEVDVPLNGAWTTEPDNVWDHRFEHVAEYPETEQRYLTSDGEPTLLSRAWHQLLIGLNSDASGWFPWTPRTRHRNLALRTSRVLSGEVLARFATQVAAQVEKPDTEAHDYVLALNSLPGRTREVSLVTEGPLAFIQPSGDPIPTAVRCQDGKWSARARVELPAYGYRLLGLLPTTEVETTRWVEGAEVRLGEKAAFLADGRLVIAEGKTRLEVSVPSFTLSDPSGAAETELVTPRWDHAETRIRESMFGRDLEVFAELAWAVWLRLVIGLRVDRIEVMAEVHVDMPRRIGNLKYDPEGLLLQFRGRPGEVFYDIPYATIRHPNTEPSFVAAQRLVAMASPECPFGLIALGGNQSFKVVGQDGTIAANLGASTQGRPDTRPECRIRADGTGEHRISSAGDPFLRSYTHRFALVFTDPAETAIIARSLRTAVPLVRVQPGGGDWPTEQTLLPIAPDTAYVTAFRTTGEGRQVVVNDISGQASRASCGGASADVVPYGVVTLCI